VGYYLAAPCHRDTTWLGKYQTLRDLGWGSALLYVGQQDWARVPDEILPSRAESGRGTGPDNTGTSALLRAPASVVCSASLLSSAQGALEAADAADKAQREGFPRGSTIFLDVEYVTSVASPLRDYVAAWVAAVLSDGRYEPGIYCAKSNAADFYQTASQAFAAAGRHDSPSFWIASSVGFSLDRQPTDVGLPYAAVWQGRFDVTESYGGVARTIDADVASTPSPSAPITAVAGR
jgi:hypothetical protein